MSILSKFGISLLATLLVVVYCVGGVVISNWIEAPFGMGWSVFALGFWYVWWPVLLICLVD